MRYSGANPGCRLSPPWPDIRHHVSNPTLRRRAAAPVPGRARSARRLVERPTATEGPMTYARARYWDGFYQRHQQADTDLNPTGRWAASWLLVLEQSGSTRV